MLTESELKDVCVAISTTFREKFGEIVASKDYEIDTNIIVESIVNITACFTAGEIVAACEFGLKEPTKEAKLNLLRICQMMANDYIEEMYVINEKDKH